MDDPWRTGKREDMLLVQNALYIPLAQACIRCKVARRTLYRWIAQGDVRVEYPHQRRPYVNLTDVQVRLRHGKRARYGWQLTLC